MWTSFYGFRSLPKREGVFFLGWRVMMDQSKRFIARRKIEYLDWPSMGNVLGLIKPPQCFSPLSPPHHHAHANKRIAQESHHSYLSISQVKKQLYEIIFNVAHLSPVLKIAIWRMWHSDWSSNLPRVEDVTQWLLLKFAQGGGCDTVGLGSSNLPRVENVT